ncbi:hypothetical protein UFOVP29_283 [uncultured Caudovirales phage]|uniref:Uncharacterized protein n=1 Tax=uncultured Caudovirales phage TaxID=2100421 RepID=A0A6J5KLI0_9CAUD|nr:hypothetical protein UFOVP29_283 [uncultured Caudovirales phage]
MGSRAANLTEGANFAGLTTYEPTAYTPYSRPTVSQESFLSTVESTVQKSTVQKPSAIDTVPPNDLRARLRAKDNFRANSLIYAGPGSVLRNTGGLVWPYTPTITYSQDVTYADMSPVHSNQEILSYTRTPATKLSIVGNFTSQTVDEATYNLACIHFLRVVTKMSFGSSIDPQPGTPPPILIFEAHGAGMFKALPVVVTAFSITLPPDPDYISINVPGAGLTRLPTMFDISVNITVQHSPKKLREWSLDEFRSGVYLSRGGWI